MAAVGVMVAMAIVVVVGCSMAVVWVMVAVAIVVVESRSRAAVVFGVRFVEYCSMAAVAP